MFNINVKVFMKITFSFRFCSNIEDFIQILNNSQLRVNESNLDRIRSVRQNPMAILATDELKNPSEKYVE